MKAADTTEGIIIQYFIHKKKGVYSIMKNQNTYTGEFYTVTQNGVVSRIGKMSVIQPRITYNGKKTKWFDDSKLLKTSKEGD